MWPWLTCESYLLYRRTVVLGQKRRRLISSAAQECSKRYRKLRFLPVASGDVIESVLIHPFASPLSNKCRVILYGRCLTAMLMTSVYYEVGRIDELPSFPYPEIGVENDGILVRLFPTTLRMGHPPQCLEAMPVKSITVPPVESEYIGQG